MMDYEQLGVMLGQQTETIIRGASRVAAINRDALYPAVFSALMFRYPPD